MLAETAVVRKRDAFRDARVLANNLEVPLSAWQIGWLLLNIRLSGNYGYSCKRNAQLIGSLLCLRATCCPLLPPQCQLVCDVVLIDIADVGNRDLANVPRYDQLDIFKPLVGVQYHLSRLLAKLSNAVGTGIIAGKR